MTDHFYDVGLSQGERGVHSRDLADADGDSMDDALSKCGNPDCGLLHHDGPDGCCSTACAVEVGRSDDAREPERDDRLAAQEGEA